jgi:hypothetical protein
VLEDILNESKEEQKNVVDYMNLSMSEEGTAMEVIRRYGQEIKDNDPFEFFYTPEGKTAIGKTV